MLDVLRQRGKSLVVVAIFAVIILVFIFWGVGPMNTGSGRAVATVNGDEVTIEAYRAAYDRQIDAMREALGDQFTEEAIEEMGVKERTINILINNMLIVEAAEDEGVKVTDEDVQKIILGVPAFKKNGAFDKETYLAVLKQNRIAPADFETNVKNDIIIDKMQELQTKGIIVTDEDAWATFSGDNRGVSFEFAFIDPRKFASSAEVTDEEAKKYFDEHNKNFTVPTMLKAFVVRVEPADAGKGAGVTDADVKGYFEANKPEFMREEKVKASHILIRPAGSAEAKATAEGLLKRIKKGESFAALAKKHSTDPGSAKNGGQLDWFERGRMVKPFEDAAFALKKKGELSGVVESEHGFHIIRLDDKRDGGITPFEEVKDDIRKALAKNQAMFLAREKAASLAKPLEDAKDQAALEKAAADAGLKGRTTELFSEADAAGELPDATLKSAVFGLNAGGVSAPVEGAYGAYYIAKVLERVEEHVPPFEEAKKAVKSALTVEKAVTLARAEADAIVKALNDGTRTFDTVKAEGKHRTGRTSFTSKAKGVIPELGLYLAGNEKLLELTADKPYYHDVVSHDMGFFVFKFNEAKEVDRAGFDAIKDRFKERLLAVRQQEAMVKWLTNLREKSKVKINSELL